MANGRRPFYLKINGEPIKDAMITNLIVKQELGQHWFCDVEFRLIDQQRPPVESYLGKAFEFVTITEEAEYAVFEGFVLEAELEYGLHGDYLARLQSVTRSYLLQVTPEENYFLKKTLREVAQTLVSDDGLELAFNADGEMARLSYVQWGESDFDFLRRAADDQGCFMRPTANGIEIRKGFQSVGTKLRWHDEYGLSKFSLKGKLGQPSFNGTAYDPRTMESKTYRQVKKEPQFYASATNMVHAVREQSKQLPPDRLVFDDRTPTLAAYQKRLEKESVRSIGSKITAYGHSREPRLRPGNSVRLEGISFDAEGEYGIISVVHYFDQSGGYRNEFTATPWKGYTNPEPPAPARFLGVVPARILAHNDPRGMGRVQIQYDWMEGAQTAWARMTTPSGGGGRGFMFMPEIGDEVLVAFEHGDPERPFVVGALWNGKDSAPRQGFAEDEGVEEVAANSDALIGTAVQIACDVARNDIKRIVTKSGHRIQMVDSPGKTAIVLSTPAGQMVQLIDNCPETGGRQMLCLTSPGDIFLNAPDGRVHIRSKFYSKEVG